MSEYFTHALTIAPGLRQLASDGSSLPVFLHQCQLPPSLQSYVGWVDYVQFELFWERAAAEVGRRDFALQATSKLDPSSYGAISSLILSAENLGSAIEITQRFFRILTNTSTYRLRNLGDQAKLISLRHAPTNPYYPQASDYALNILHRYLQASLGPQWRPQEVHFDHRHRDRLPMYEEHFQCPVLLGQPERGIVFPRELLYAPFSTYDRDTHRALLFEVQREMLNLYGEMSFLDRIRVAVREGLPLHKHSLSDVAQKIGMSSRSLQRRLKAENTSLRQIIDEVRIELSAQYLQRGDMRVEEISSVLAFSSPPAFYRAYRRWHGSPPSVHRASGARNPFPGPKLFHG